jgi:hypothetical protein
VKSAAILHQFHGSAQMQIGSKSLLQAVFRSSKIKKPVQNMT